MPKVKFSAKIGDFRNTYYAHYDEVGHDINNLSFHLGGDYSRIDDPEYLKILTRKFLLRRKRVDAEACEYPSD